MQAQAQMAADRFEQPELRREELTARRIEPKEDDADRVTLGFERHRHHWQAERFGELGDVRPSGDSIFVRSRRTLVPMLRSRWSYPSV